MALFSRPSLVDRIPQHGRDEFVAMSGEFVGTFLFLFFAFSGTQIANEALTSGSSADAQAPDPAKLLYISLAFGISLMVNVWIFYRITGAALNPAVSFAFLLIGGIKPLRAVLTIIGQLLGGIAAAGVVSALFPGELAVATTLSSGTSTVRGLFIEMFLTSQLVLTILFLAVEKHKASFVAPIGIGLALFIAELSGVYFTGGSLNPARSLGPCVVLKSFPGYHWIYWLGPFLGSLIASGFYGFVHCLGYKGVNPGQDFDELESAIYSPEKDLTRPVPWPSSIEAPTSNAGSSSPLNERSIEKQPTDSH